MRSDINTLESEFSKEEMRFIKDYLRFVKDQLLNPVKPEIHIGAARYPIGRLVIKRSIIKDALRNFERFKDTRINENIKNKVSKQIESLKNVQTIVENLKQRGKTIKKRK